MVLIIIIIMFELYLHDPVRGDSFTLFVVYQAGEHILLLVYGNLIPTCQNPNQLIACGPNP